MYNSLIKKLTRILFFIGSSLLLAILVLTLANIFMRAFGENLRGVIELSSYLAACATGLCIPFVQAHNSHANAGILFEKLPKKVQEIQSIIVSIVCFSLSLGLSFELLDLTLFVHEGMELVDGFDIPSAIFIALLTFGLFIQSLIILLELLQLSNNFLKKTLLKNVNFHRINFSRALVK